jgi:membrane protein required for colicin V production
MVDFSMLDMVIIGLVFFLSLKGLVNGFIKEFFNFIGLIGGVYFASRMNMVVGEFVSGNVFPIKDEPFLKLAGFVSVFLAIWIFSNLVSSIFEKTLPEEVSFVSRILGYALTILRYIAIFAIIITSIQNVELIAEKLTKHSADSQVIPTLNEIGVDLLNMEGRDINNTAEINATKDKIDLQSFDIDNNKTKE